MKRSVLLAFILLPCCEGLLLPILQKRARRQCTRCEGRALAIETTKKALTFATIGALLGGSYVLSREKEIYTPPAGSLEGKTIVVTGASSGLGLETAKRLAAAGASMILTARSDIKGELAVATVNAYLEEQGAVYKDQSVSFKTVDFSNLKEVKNVDWSDVDRIDVLVNNAGVMAIPDRTLTTDRIEIQMQSNHLGPFLLTAMLAEKLSDTARIVNVSSSAHQIAAAAGGLDFEFLWKAELGYNPWLWYGYSKLANIYFTQELQRRVDASSKQWTVHAVHPGAVATNLGRYSFANADTRSNMVGGILAGVVLRSPSEGAETQIWLAAGNGEGGKYYVDKRYQENVPKDISQAGRLWEDSEILVGTRFEITEEE